MIKVLIVDDERKCREVLSNLLDKFFDNVKIVDMVDSVEGALSAVSHHHPDLVFLDIEMPNGDGFEFLDRCKDIDFEIIFVTAYDQYAIKAFEFSAIDYLLKPINLVKLKEAIDKFQDRSEFAIEKQKFEVLLENLKDQSKNVNGKIGLPTTTGILFVNVSDIIRCKSFDHYTHFYTKDGQEIVVSKILKDYDTLLSSHGFFRVHQSHLINLQQISKYIKVDGSYVEMADGSTIPIAKRKREIFNRAIENMLPPS